MDAAGNSALVRVDDIDIDTTAPSVDLTGGRTDTIADTVTIGCTATDSLSGVASDTCAGVAGTRPAWEYALGDTNVSAPATDAAGNDGSGSATVTVRATAASLCTLTQRWFDKRAVAEALCVKLEHGDPGSLPRPPRRAGGQERERRARPHADAARLGAVAAGRPRPRSKTRAAPPTAG